MLAHDVLFHWLTMKCELLTVPCIVQDTYKLCPRSTQHVTKAAVEAASFLSLHDVRSLKANTPLSHLGHCVLLDMHPFQHVKTYIQHSMLLRQMTQTGIECFLIRWVAALHFIRKMQRPQLEASRANLSMS